MVKIILTAFGKFHGVKNNPTKDILKYIQSVKNFKDSVYKDIIYTALIEVSAKGVAEHLHRIRNSIQNKYPTEKIIQPTFSAKNCSILSQTSTTSTISIAPGLFTFCPHLTSSGETR